MFLNGSWVTVTGGDARYIKKLSASDVLGSAEASKTQEDVVSEREARAREVADVCGAVKSMQGWVTDVASTVEARACEIVLLTELKDLKFQPTQAEKPTKKILQRYCSSNSQHWGRQMVNISA